jgi:hypothetical protein
VLIEDHDSVLRLTCHRTCPFQGGT